MMDDLNTIVLQAQAGDLAAFDQLITRYQDFAMATALRFLDQRADAQDAVQNAFIEAYYSLAKLRNPLAFGTWLRRIVLKHCDRQIRGKKPQFIALDDLALQDEQVAFRPNALLEKLQFEQAIHAAVANLPPIYRMIADGYYLQNQSLTALAHCHNLSYTTTKKRLFTARKLLKARILAMSTIHVETPKAKNNLSDRIRFFIAVRKNELTTVRQILHRSPALVDAVAQWDAGSYGYYNILGATALHWAVGRGNLPMAKLLVEFSADINASNERIAPPLTVAVQMRRPALITWLLEQGADVNKQAHNGQTALHRGVIRQQTALVEMLLAAGADATITDNHGRSALDWAILTHYTQGVALLEAKGMVSSATARPPFTPSSKIIWETGIKIIDAITPLKLGGSNTLMTPISGIGLDVILASLMRSFVDNMGGTVVVIGATRAGFEIENRLLEWRNLGVDRALDVFFSGTTPDSDAARRKPIKLGVKKAVAYSENQPVLLITYANALKVAGAKDLLKPIAENQAITLLCISNQSIGAMLPAELAQVDSAITFDAWRRTQGLFPAIDAVRSIGKQFEHDAHAEIAHAVRRLLARYVDLDIIYRKQGFDGFDMPLFDPQDKVDAMRARLLHHYLCQRLPLVEPWAAVPGEYVALADTLATCRQILAGELDWTDEEEMLDFGRFDPTLT